jgi:hypothetical protein
MGRRSDPAFVGIDPGQDVGDIACCRLERRTTSIPRRLYRPVPIGLARRNHP